MSMELGPYSNFHELNQDWFLNEFNKVLAEWAAMNKSFNDLNEAFNNLHDYVHDYFKNLIVESFVFPIRAILFPFADCHLQHRT